MSFCLSTLRAGLIHLVFKLNSGPILESFEFLSHRVILAEKLARGSWCPFPIAKPQVLEPIHHFRLAFVLFLFSLSSVCTSKNVRRFSFPRIDLSKYLNSNTYSEMRLPLCLLGLLLIVESQQQCTRKPHEAKVSSIPISLSDLLFFS